MANIPRTEEIQIETPARSVASKFMVALPALLLMGFAMHSDSTQDDFEFVTADVETNERISDYVPIMKMTEPFLSKPLNAEDARMLASAWVREAEEGNLRPIPQTDPKEALVEGATGQLYRAQHILSRTLAEQAKREEKNGESIQAAKDWILSLRVSQILQYSDPMTAVMTGIKVRNGLDQVSKLGAKLGDADKRWLAHEVARLETDGSAVGWMIFRTRQLYADTLLKEGRAWLSDPTLVRLTHLRESKHQGTATAEFDTARRELLEKSPQSPQLRVMVDMVERTIRSELSVREKIAEVRSQLEGSQTDFSENPAQI